MSQSLPVGKTPRWILAFDPMLGEGGAIELMRLRGAASKTFEEPTYLLDTVEAALDDFGCRIKYRSDDLSQTRDPEHPFVDLLHYCRFRRLGKTAAELGLKQDGAKYADTYWIPRQNLQKIVSGLHLPLDARQLEAKLDGYH